MKTSKSKMIQTVIALLIMFVAGFIIPTWGPVTRMGVQYLCIMVGWIYLSIVTGGLLLSSVIALTACVIPGYYTAASIVTTTLGNSITLLMIFIFIMVYIFQKTKTGEFLVRWLLSRKVVNGRPYLFTAFFFLAIIVIGAVIGSFGIILLAIAILSAVSEVTGMSIKDDWFRFLLLSTVALSGTTEVLFPFKPYSVLYMSIFDAQLNTIGTACDGNTWLITAIIMAALSFVFLMALARFVFKFDLTRMKELDVSVLQTEEFKKMSKKQVIVLVSVILTFFYPFILMLLPSESGVYLFLNNIGQNLFMGFVICLLCLIHVDGEPIAEIGDVFKNGTNWQIIFAVGSVIAIGGAMAADVCGHLAAEHLPGHLRRYEHRDRGDHRLCPQLSDHAVLLQLRHGNPVPDGTGTAGCGAVPGGHQCLRVPCPDRYRHPDRLPAALRLRSVRHHAEYGHLRG